MTGLGKTAGGAGATLATLGAGLGSITGLGAIEGGAGLNGGDFVSTASAPLSALIFLGERSLGDMF
jgi:hypothetical protein